MVSVCSPLPAALAVELSGRADADAVLDELRARDRARRAHVARRLPDPPAAALLPRRRPRAAPARGPPAAAVRRGPLVVGAGGAGARAAPRRAGRRPRADRGAACTASAVWPAARRGPRAAAARAGRRGRRRPRGGPVARAHRGDHPPGRAGAAGRRRRAGERAPRLARGARRRARRAARQRRAAGHRPGARRRAVRPVPGPSTRARPSPSWRPCCTLSRGAAEFGNPAVPTSTLARDRAGAGPRAGASPRPRLPGGAEPVDARHAGRPCGATCRAWWSRPSRPWPPPPAAAGTPLPGRRGRWGCSPTPTCWAATRRPRPRGASEALGSGTPLPPEAAYTLHAVHGAAVADQGRRAEGLAEMRAARAEFGDTPAPPSMLAALAVLEHRAGAAEREPSRPPQRSRLARPQRIGRHGRDAAARAWTEAAAGRHEAARTLVAPVLEPGRG